MWEVEWEVGSTGLRLQRPQDNLRIGKEELRTGERGGLAGSILTRLPTFGLEQYE